MQSGDCMVPAFHFTDPKCWLVDRFHETNRIGQMELKHTQIHPDETALRGLLKSARFCVIEAGLLQLGEGSGGAIRGRKAPSYWTEWSCRQRP